MTGEIQFIQNDAVSLIHKVFLRLIATGVWLPRSQAVAGLQFFQRLRIQRFNDRVSTVEPAKEVDLLTAFTAKRAEMRTGGGGGRHDLVANGASGGEYHGCISGFAAETGTWRIIRSFRFLSPGRHADGILKPDNIEVQRSRSVPAGHQSRSIGNPENFRRRFTAGDLR